MVQRYQYWTFAGGLKDQAPGFTILAGDTDWHGVEWYYDGKKQTGFPEKFAQHAADNLSYVYWTTAGQTVIDYLTNNNIPISVGFSTVGNSARALNSPASMTQVASEVLSGNRQPGHATQTALQALEPSPERFALFALKVNEQPKWDIATAPTRGGGQGGYGLNLQVNEAQAWVQNGIAPVRLDDAGKLQLRLATVVALETHSAAGPGCGSQIGLTYDPGNEMNRERPPGIGLAHELVHAYYSSRGEQPAQEQPNGYPPVVLFEFKCVGLGPWDGVAISENGIRAEWWRPVGRYYFAMDKQNCRIPSKREEY
jgi:hypothetical protein